MYTAVFMVRVHGMYTTVYRPCTRPVQAVYGLYTAVYTVEYMCTGRVHMYTAVYTAVHTGHIHVFTARVQGRADGP